MYDSCHRLVWDEFRSVIGVGLSLQNVSLITSSREGVSFIRLWCKVSTAYPLRYLHIAFVEGVRVGCASARTQHPRAFIRDAISAPGRHAPSLAPPPLVKTSCFHCSKYHNLNLKTDRVFVFCFLGLTLSGTLFFSRIEECRLGFADWTSAKERRSHGQICWEQI